MCRLDNLEVRKTTIGNNIFYFIGNRFMFVDGLFIDTGNRTVNSKPFTEDELKRILNSLENRLDK